MPTALSRKDALVGAGGSAIAGVVSLAAVADNEGLLWLAIPIVLFTAGLLGAIIPVVGKLSLIFVACVLALWDPAVDAIGLTSVSAFPITAATVLGVSYQLVRARGKPQTMGVHASEERGASGSKGTWLLLLFVVVAIALFASAGLTGLATSLTGVVLVIAIPAIAILLLSLQLAGKL